MKDKLSETLSQDEVCLVTEVSTLFFYVSSGLKQKLHILIFGKCKYLHVKIAS